MSLQPDSSTRGADRRRSPRFPLPIGRVSGEAREATLLNISRHGMAIEVPVSTSYARGDSHCFTLQDLSHTVEVEGRVRWVRSDWREQSMPGGVQYIQVAGFTFEKILTREPAGIWSNLESVPSEPEEHEADPLVHGAPAGISATRDMTGPPRKRTTTVPALSNRTVSTGHAGGPKLLVPLDGSSLRVGTLTVVCKIAEPEDVTLVSINGVSATLEGREAAAEIRLEPGINRLSVLICREDGSYRTYSLGTVTRKELS